MIEYYNYITLVLISYKSKKKIQNFLKNLSNKNKIIIIENSNIKIFTDQFNNENLRIYNINNKGYAGSINFAREKIDTKYFFVFNPDVEEIDDRKINYFFLKATELKDNFSCLGPRYKNISSKTLKQSDEKKEIGKLNSISGASMFFNTENFDIIGGFDENFFLYFEETDYCIRARKKKLFSFQLNQIKITHNVGTSYETHDKVEEKKLKDLLMWHFIWSKFYFFKKHYGFFISIIYFLPILIRTIIKIIFFELLSKYEKKRKYEIRYDGLISSIKNTKSYKRIDNF